jgi:hypothetical protein
MEGDGFGSRAHGCRRLSASVPAVNGTTGGSRECESRRYLRPVAIPWLAESRCRQLLLEAGLESSEQPPECIEASTNRDCCSSQSRDSERSVENPPAAGRGTAHLRGPWLRPTETAACTRVTPSLELHRNAIQENQRGPALAPD